MRPYAALTLLLPESCSKVAVVLVQTLHSFVKSDTKDPRFAMQIK
jgi:hypothetical protein